MAKRTRPGRIPLKKELAERFDLDACENPEAAADALVSTAIFLEEILPNNLEKHGLDNVHTLLDKGESSVTSSPSNMTACLSSAQSGMFKFRNDFERYMEATSGPLCNNDRLTVNKAAWGLFNAKFAHIYEIFEGVQSAAEASDLTEARRVTELDAIDALERVVSFGDDRNEEDEALDLCQLMGL
jgi:hypothetical protein